MRHRRLYRALTVAVAATALTLGAGAAPASAHYSEERLNQWAAYQEGKCVWANVLQNHGYHSVKTFPINSCAPGGSSTYAPGRIADFIAYYKTRTWGTPGEACGYFGWNTNQQSDDVLVHWHPWDIWDSGCNYGAGVNVWLSIDTWHYADRYGDGQWTGRSFNPATKHCHCP